MNLNPPMSSSSMMTTANTIMDKYKNKLILLTLCLCVVAAASCTVMGKEEPYQGQMWSPNRDYYVQKYRTFGVLPTTSMPGQGSDSVDGYIRVHAKDGKVISERHYTFIRDTEAVWSRDKVFLMGGSVSDDEGVTLPGRVD